MILTWKTFPNQASSIKKSQASRPVMCFCTAVIIEVLGSVSSLDKVLNKVLPFVNSGLRSGAKQSQDHKVRFLQCHQRMICFSSKDNNYNSSRGTKLL